MLWVSIPPFFLLADFGFFSSRCAVFRPMRCLCNVETVPKHTYITRLAGLQMRLKIMHADTKWRVPIIISRQPWDDGEQELTVSHEGCKGR